jgi:hypothetical protein
MSGPDSAELALAALARDLVEEIAAGRALELAAAAHPAQELAKPPPRGQLPEIPRPLKGAAAVHPVLHGKHVTLPGDTLSGHAHAHVPRPFEMPAPDARDAALGQANAALDAYRRDSLERIEQERAAARAQQSGVPEPGSYAPLDDDAYAAHVARAGRIITAALQAGHGTGAEHTLDGAPGKPGSIWAPERAALHNEIVKSILDRAVAVPSEARGLVVTGPDRAARAAALRQLPDAGRHALVSADDIKAELARRGKVPPAEGLSPAERSALVHHEAGHVANLAAAALAARRKNLALDMPGADQAALAAHLGRLAAHGYAVHGVLADAPADAATGRNRKAHRRGLEAYRQGKGDGGRLAVAQSGTAHRDAFEALKPRFASWQRFDAAKGSPVPAEQSEVPQQHGITSVEDLIRGQR